MFVYDANNNNGPTTLHPIQAALSARKIRLINIPSSRKHRNYSPPRLITPRRCTTREMIRIISLLSISFLLAKYECKQYSRQLSADRTATDIPSGQSLSSDAVSTLNRSRLRLPTQIRSRRYDAPFHVIHSRPQHGSRRRRAGRSSRGKERRPACQGEHQRMGQEVAGIVGQINTSCA